MKQLLSIFTIFSSLLVNAQNNSSAIRFAPLPIIAFNYQTLKTYDLGFKLGIYKQPPTETHDFNMLAAGAGIQLFTVNSVTYCPLFYTITGYLYTGKQTGVVGGIRLNQFKILGRSDFLFSPEAGFSFYGIVLTYGYHFNVDNKDLQQYTQHRIGIRYAL